MCLRIQWCICEVHSQMWYRAKFYVMLVFHGAITTGETGLGGKINLVIGLPSHDERCFLVVRGFACTVQSQKIWSTLFGWCFDNCQIPSSGGARVPSPIHGGSLQRLYNICKANHRSNPQHLQLITSPGFWEMPTAIKSWRPKLREKVWGFTIFFTNTSVVAPFVNLRSVNTMHMMSVR